MEDWSNLLDKYLLLDKEKIKDYITKDNELTFKKYYSPKMTLKVHRVNTLTNEDITVEEYPGIFMDSTKTGISKNYGYKYTTYEQKPYTRDNNNNGLAVMLNYDLIKDVVHDNILDFNIYYEAPITVHMKHVDILTGKEITDETVYTGKFLGQTINNTEEKVLDDYKYHSFEKLPFVENYGNLGRRVLLDLEKIKDYITKDNQLTFRKYYSPKLTLKVHRVSNLTGKDITVEEYPGIFMDSTKSGITKELEGYKYVSYEQKEYTCN